MKRFLPHLVSTSGFTLAASLLLVGLVAAVTSAQGDVSPRAAPTTTLVAPTDSAVVDDDGAVQDDADLVEGSLTASERDATLDQRLSDVEARLAEIDLVADELTEADKAFSGRIDGLESDAARLDEATESLRRQFSDIVESIDTMARDLENLGTRVTDVAASVESLAESVETIAGKTVLLDSEGKYSGPVAPSQMKPRLGVDDVTGKWPLDRTTGTLEVAKVGPPSWGCSGDSRYNVFVTLDSFGRYACLRLLK